MSRARNGWVLPVSLLLGLLLGLVPLPGILQPLRPYWLALVLAYWLLEEPEHMGLGMSFALGVLADLVFGGLLGEQALRLVVMAFILDRFRARMRFFPLSQQIATRSCPSRNLRIALMVAVRGLSKSRPFPLSTSHIWEKTPLMSTARILTSSPSVRRK